MKENEEQLLLRAKYEVECVIVGGVAATLYGSSYLTYDLDICYARHPANLERFARPFDLSMQNCVAHRRICLLSRTLKLFNVG